MRHVAVSKRKLLMNADVRGSVFFVFGVFVSSFFGLVETPSL